ncbi:MAG: helix-turn-helix transcriptional regulator [Planctomycetes bacterium]|nr:helix-turn-helix transcriptional regulator [Planctomycetota bacterium]
MVATETVAGRGPDGALLDVDVLEDPAAAAMALEPGRGELLAALVEPASAAVLAQRLGRPRQKINYHLRALERHGLVREVDSRKWGGITERRVQATARSYLISPIALGPLASDPERSHDKLSASYLLALAARVVRDVGTLLRRARSSGMRLATLSIDTEIAFRSAADRAAFSRELALGIRSLAARYHAPEAEGARFHRLVVVAHPSAGPQVDSDTLEKDSKA